MILVADAGSTKASWAIVRQDKLSYFETTGINPYFNSREEIGQKLLIEFPNQFPYELVSEVHFFGAGCGAEDRKRIVWEALHSRFFKATIFVETDLYGAGLSLCDSSPGLVGILGTGSNSCFFDGEGVRFTVSSGGFILGDEGSGSDIGKHLLIGFMRNRLPLQLSEVLRARFDLSGQEILKKVYTEKDPNRYLASFVRFVKENESNEFCDRLIRDAFDRFCRNQLSGYTVDASIPVHFVGSVAFQFQEQLKEVLKKNGRILGNVVQQPIEKMAAYFQQKTQPGVK